MAAKVKNKIIIIHSLLSYGFVGGNTTALVLQLNGQEVISIPTVLYSNHLGYSTVGGGAVPDAFYSSVLEGILSLGILSEVSAVITGFFGSPGQVRITAGFIKKIKASCPEITYLCDPVMGDAGRDVYVLDGVPLAIIEELIPLADIITPNHFELQLIFGKTINAIEEFAALYHSSPYYLHQKFVVTGCHFSSTPLQMIDNIVADERECKVISVEQIHTDPVGTGDLFAAHLTSLLLKKVNLVDAARATCRVLKCVLLQMAQYRRKEFILDDIFFSMRCLSSQNNKDHTPIKLPNHLPQAKGTFHKK